MKEKILVKNNFDTLTTTICGEFEQKNSRLLLFFLTRGTSRFFLLYYLVVFFIVPLAMKTRKTIY